jgi:hypothetical protein
MHVFKIVFIKCNTFYKQTLLEILITYYLHIKVVYMVSQWIHNVIIINFINSKYISADLIEIPQISTHVYLNYEVKLYEVSGSKSTADKYIQRSQLCAYLVYDLVPT